MSDLKYFERGKVHELREDLALDKKDAKASKRKNALKKVIANMTMGNDMSPLFPDVLGCIDLPFLESKKMVYLYLIFYGKHKPDMAATVVSTFSRDASDSNPLIRALAIRTMANIPVIQIANALIPCLKLALADKDPYVTKTAAIAVAKLYMFNSDLANPLMRQLQSLLTHENPMVVANALVSLMSISAESPTYDFQLDLTTANKLLSVIEECNEWSQVYILEALTTIMITDAVDAAMLIERVLPRLQHSNSAVVLSSVRVVVYMCNFIVETSIKVSYYKKIGPPLVTLLHGPPETQFIALRNILLILQRFPDFMENELRVFFCKYNDPIYVKLSKLEIMVQLATVESIDLILSELKEYASEVDVAFVRKSVRSIGRCAIKVESSADRCVKALIELVSTKVSYVVQEAIVVIKDIFRKYPNRYESVIATLCENLESLDETEAKASMIWIIGQYADRIENANELLEHFLSSFHDEQAEVQLAMLTAIVKLFIVRPTAGQDLVPRILKYATEEVDDPDLRDRGFIYWRLLSTDPVAAKAIILSDKPAITTEVDHVDGGLLNQLLYNISTLASVRHKAPPTKPILMQLISRFPTDQLSLPRSENVDFVEEKKAVITSTAQSQKPVQSEGPSQLANDFNPYGNDDLYAPKENVQSGALIDLLGLEDDIISAPPTSLNISPTQNQYAMSHLNGPILTQPHNNSNNVLNPALLPGQSASGPSNLNDLLALNTTALSQPQTSISTMISSNPFSAPSIPLNQVTTNPFAAPSQQIGAGLPQPALVHNPFSSVSSNGLGGLNRNSTINNHSNPPPQPNSLGITNPFGATPAASHIPDSGQLLSAQTTGTSTWSQASSITPSAKLGGLGAFNSINHNNSNIASSQSISRQVTGFRSAPGTPAPQLGTKSIIDPFAKSSLDSNPVSSTPGAGTFTSGGAGLGLSTPDPISSLSSNLQGVNLGVLLSPVNSVPPREELLSVSIQNGLVLPKSLALPAQNGKGLEIMVTFARRNNQVLMEMTLSNKALEPFSGFAMVFNKNSFSLQPAGPIEYTGSVFPNQSVEISAKLKFDGLVQPSNPINNLQVAFKTNAGILYFQTLVPLHVLFHQNGQIEGQAWLQMWKQAPLEQSEKISPFVFEKSESIPKLRNKLISSNVFVIAERVVDGANCIYTCVKLEDGTLFLSEVKLDSSLTKGTIATRSYASHLLPLYNVSLTQILKQ